MSQTDNKKEPIRELETVIRQEGFFAGTTVGRSMYPMLRNRKDMIVIEPVKNRLEKYDVPLYKSNGTYILHRVIKVEPEGYVIRGDNCIAKEYVTDDMILGVLTEFYRTNRSGKKKKVNMKGFGYFLYVRIWHYTFIPRRVAKALCRRMRKLMKR